MTTDDAQDWLDELLEDDEPEPTPIADDASRNYPYGFTVVTLRPSRARPRALCLGRASKPRTKRAKRQHVGGHTPHMRTSGW